jgi:hypothetical protein
MEAVDQILRSVAVAIAEQVVIRGRRWPSGESFEIESPDRARCRVAVSSNDVICYTWGLHVVRWVLYRWESRNSIHVYCWKTEMALSTHQ